MSFFDNIVGVYDFVEEMCIVYVMVLVLLICVCVDESGVSVEWLVVFIVEYGIDEIVELWLKVFLCMLLGFLWCLYVL